VRSRRHHRRLRRRCLQRSTADQPRCQLAMR
jgi:hypothetical protein